MNVDINQEEIGDLDETQNANHSPATNQDLHIANMQQIPEDLELNEPDEPASVPGCLPNYNIINKPSSINWGKRSDGSTVHISSSIISDAYNEITTWRKNVFLVPLWQNRKGFH